MRNRSTSLSAQAKQRSGRRREDFAPLWSRSGAICLRWMVKMTWLLIFARAFCLAIWLGGLLVIDFVETPIRFRTPGISKEQATALGSRLFATFDRIQLGIGVILLGVSIAIARKTSFARIDVVELILVAAMLFFAVIQAACLAPRMFARMTLVGSQNPNDGGLRLHFRTLHVAYVSLDILKILVGLALLLCVSWSYSRHIG